MVSFSNNLSDLHLGRDADGKNINPLLQVTLTWHRSSPHQFRRCGHDRIDSHGPDRNHRLSFGVIRHEFGLIGLTLQYQIIKTIRGVATVA